MALPRRGALSLHLRRRIGALLLTAARLSRSAARDLHTRRHPPETWFSLNKSHRSDHSSSLWLLLRLRTRRQNVVQPQIHGCGSVVVGPAAGQAQRGHGAGELASAKEFHAIAEFGVVHLAKRL